MRCWIALGRYLFISSADVYRNHGLIHRIETGEPDSGPLSEGSPKRSVLYPYREASPRVDNDPSKWMDSYDKIPIEAKVQSLRMDWTICRLPMVYGGDTPAVRRFDWIKGLMQSKAQKAELPTAWLNWMTTYGHLDNVAASIIGALTHEAAKRQVFNLVDHQPMTHLHWLAEFRRVFDWSCEIVPTDASDHPIARMIANLDLSVPLKLSGAKQCEMLGIQPVLGLDECIRRAS